MFSLPKTYEVYQEQIDAYLALAQDQVKGIMAQVQDRRSEVPEILREKWEHYSNLLIEQRPRNLDELKELALRLFNIVVKQMPKDLDEVKEMAQRVVELIHAKIPIGKKDQ